MAGSAIISRLSSARLKSLPLKLKSNKSVSPLKSSFQSQVSSPVNRISGISRLPVELSCLMSMMPLHSAVASARLRSCLAMESQSWGLIPQVTIYDTIGPNLWEAGKCITIGPNLWEAGLSMPL